MAQEQEEAIVESDEKNDSAVVASDAIVADEKKKRKGFFSRMWNGIFRVRGGDFEKRLQYISREEATVLSRMKRRSITWRRLTRNLVVFSVVIAVGYAIMTTRKEDLDWKMRSFRILPMFLLPALSAVAYSSIVSFSKMFDRRDQKTLEKLRSTSLKRGPTKDRQRSWGLDVPSMCILCDEQDETLDHLLITCRFAQELWNRLLLPTSGHGQTSFPQLLHWADTNSSPKEVKTIERYILQATVYEIWCERNARIHQRPSTISRIISSKIQAIVRSKLIALAQISPGIYGSPNLLQIWFRLFQPTEVFNGPFEIPRYDPDPAAKAAAATVLASKLGADSGLKVFVGDESQHDPSSGKSNDMEVNQSRGLRNRRQPNTRPHSSGSTPAYHSDDESHQTGTNERIPGTEHNQQMLVDHYNPQGYATHDGSWISRIAALLVGEDPTQSYALICGNCHMHNGLARKEDFPYITYYCPHCHALNKPNRSEDDPLLPPVSATPVTVSQTSIDSSEVVNNSEELDNSSSSSERGNSPIPVIDNTPEIKEETVTTETGTVPAVQEAEEDPVR